MRVGVVVMDVVDDVDVGASHRTQLAEPTEANTQLARLENVTWLEGLDWTGQDRRCHRGATKAAGPGLAWADLLLEGQT